MELITDLAVNLIAGLLGLAIGWFGKEHVLPLIRGRLRELPNLDRTIWHRRTSEEDPVMTILEIRQSGSSIRATVTRNEANLTRKFLYRGFMSGQQIVLTWADSAAKEQIIGTMVLHLAHNLKTLSGSSVYFRHAVGKVVSTERIYDRVQGSA